jgi:hypothetical protein
VQAFQATFQDDAMMVDEPTEMMAQQEAMQITQTWTDIDELDHQDPQAVTPYVEDIYANCKQREVRLKESRTVLSIGRVGWVSGFITV